MTPGEFSARFQEAWRTLWVIAAAVLGRRTDAEDVLQEAAMIGLRKISDFQEGTSFSAWMGGIVRNVARNHARKRARRQTADADPRTLDMGSAGGAGGGSGGSGGPGGRGGSGAPGGALEFDRRGRLHADQAEFDDRVIHALDTLDEVPRTCLLLRTLREMPYREISHLLGIPEGTAMSHVHRSRQTLRTLLAEGGGKEAS